MKRIFDRSDDDARVSCVSPFSFFFFFFFELSFVGKGKGIVEDCLPCDLLTFVETRVRNVGIVFPSLVIFLFLFFGQ